MRGERNKREFKRQKTKRRRTSNGSNPCYVIVWVLWEYPSINEPGIGAGSCAQPFQSFLRKKLQDRHSKPTGQLPIHLLRVFSAPFDLNTARFLSIRSHFFRWVIHFKGKIIRKLDGKTVVECFPYRNPRWLIFWLDKQSIKNY